MTAVTVLITCCIMIIGSVNDTSSEAVPAEAESTLGMSICNV